MIYIGMVAGAVLMVALYELLLLPLIVGKPRALWGRWPVEAQSDVYERGYQAALAWSAAHAESLAAAYRQPLETGLVDQCLHCKAAAATELATSIQKHSQQGA